MIHLAEMIDSAEMIYLTQSLGEAIVIQDVTNASTSQVHSIFHSRVGPSSVLGVEVSACQHMNDARTRKSSAVATSPIEVLVLKKFDLFHKLSEGVRLKLAHETRAHAQETLVTVDRVIKTQKWQKYRQRVLKETMESIHQNNNNHRRRRGGGGGSIRWSSNNPKISKYVSSMG